MLILITFELPHINPIITPAPSHEWTVSTPSTKYPVQLCKCDQSKSGHRHCLVCNHLTRSVKQDYLKHLNTHSPLPSKGVAICPHCDKSLSPKSIRNHIRQCIQRTNSGDTFNEPNGIRNPLPSVAVSNEVVFVRINHKGRPYGTHVDLVELYCEHCSKTSASYGECLHIKSARSLTTSFEPNVIPTWYVDQIQHLKEHERKQIKTNLHKCKDIGISLVQHLPVLSTSTFFSFSVAALFKDGGSSCLRISMTYDSVTNKWTLSTSSPYRLTYIAMASIYMNYFDIIPSNGMFPSHEIMKY
jgi:hypothetical protein